MVMSENVQVLWHHEFKGVNIHTNDLIKVLPKG